MAFFFLLFFFLRAGKMNSLFGVCEAFAPFVYGPLFNVIYAKTLETMSGAFFLFAAALTAPAIFFFTYLSVNLCVG